MLIDKIVQELQSIPEDRLDEIYDLIHHFHLGLPQSQLALPTPRLLTGKLSDTFFEPLPEEELQAWESGISPT